MEGLTCPECHLTFSRKDIMLRHNRNKHGINHPYQKSIDAYPPPQVGNISSTPLSERESVSSPDQTEQFVFKHPFTMTISGPTACGKTYFVKTMLQNVKHICEPTPQRIIWLYKRWQPLYDKIRQTVIRNVEIV